MGENSVIALRLPGRLPGETRSSVTLRGAQGRSGVTPKRAPSPDAECTTFPETGPHWARDGLVGGGKYFAWGTGPAGNGVAFPEAYSKLAAAGLALCLGPQVLRRRVGRRPQPANTRPMNKG